MKTSVRKGLVQVHTWTGLTLGIVIFFLALTGAGLSIRAIFEPHVNSDFLTASTCREGLPLDALAERARAAHPSGKLRSIEVAADTGSSVAVQFKNLDYVYLDPCSGEVLGIQNEYGGLFGTLDWLHRFHFLEKKVGKQIAGWATVGFLIFLIVIGIVLWWPKSRASFKSAIKYNGQLPGTARTLSLHKVAGIYTCVVLLVIAVTAIPISFPPVKQLIYSLNEQPEAPRPQSVLQEGKKPVSMDFAWAQARAAFPEREWVTLNYPKTAKDAIRIEVLEPGAPHQIAKSFLYLDAFSGRVLDVQHYETDIGLGRKVYLYCIALHAAFVGGLPYQLLFFIVSVSVLVQVYTGFSAYIRRRNRKPQRATFPVRIAKKTREADDIVSLELVDPRGRPLPAFSAGSHIDVHLKSGLVRQYSLCNDPAETSRYVIAVYRDPDTRGGSREIHDALKEGEIITISRPRNHFPIALDHKVPPLLVAGGIGITPILAMAEWLSSHNADFTLHYCAQSAKRAAFVERIRSAKFRSKVSFRFSENRTRLDIPTLLESCSEDTHLYICGSARFMDAVLGAAREKGWSEDRLHYEYFVAQTYDASDNEEFEIEVASTGEILTVPCDRTALEVLAERGIDIPTSCAEGVCGSCLTGVLAGEVEHRDMILDESARMKNDQFTPCCSRARSAKLRLDL